LSFFNNIISESLVADSRSCLLLSFFLALFFLIIQDFYLIDYVDFIY